MVLDNKRQQLWLAPALTEYDVIDYWAAFVSLNGNFALMGSEGKTTDQAEFSNMEALLNRAQQQLQDFLEHGGVFVVELRSPEVVELLRMLDTTRPRVDTYTWWWSLLPLAFTTTSPQFGAGTAICTAPLAHPLYAYLATEPAYQVSFAHEAGEPGGVSVLATDRNGRPVAVEVQIGAGIIVLIPARPDFFQMPTPLQAALIGLGFRALSERVQWTTPAIEAAQMALAEARQRHRKELAGLEGDLQSAIAARLAVVSDPTVAQLIGDHEEAMRARTPTAIGSHCYKILDVLKGEFGGHNLAAALGLSASDIDTFGRVSNDAKLGIRHARGVTSQPTEADVRMMLRVAGELVQAYINLKA